MHALQCEARVLRITCRNGIGRNKNADTMVQQIQTGLKHTDVRFDSAKDHVSNFFARERVRKTFRSTSAKRDFLQGSKSRNDGGDFWSCGSQSFPVLLCREDRDAENCSAFDQTHTALNQLVFLKNEWQEPLLDIDNDQAAV